MKTERNIRHYRHSVDSLRNVLAVCACLYAYGIPTPGEIGQIIFGFAYPALFLVSGFLVLRDDENRAGRILRTVKRTAICFGILFIVCLLMNLLADASGTVHTLCTKRFWADFLLLNLWSLPIGSLIWYVQSLLYAYLILFVLEKANLLRFDWLLMSLLFAVTVLTGELAGVTGFRFLGHEYLPGCFLTRALPYALAGCLIHRKLAQLRKIKLPALGFIATIGIVLTVAEDLILQKFGLRVYYGHYIGMAITAAAICIPIFLSRKREQKPVSELFPEAYISRFFYYAAIPVTAILMQIINNASGSMLNFYYGWRGIIIAAVSYAAAMLCLLIVREFPQIRHFFRKRRHH